jgi:O-succinylbenzoate synthase
LKGMELQLQIKPYGFQLSRPLLTAAGVLQDRRGWLLRLEDSAGRLGWGEVSPLDVEQREVCQDALVKMTRPGVVWTASSLERWLAIAPAAWAFAIGAALAELDGELGSATCGGWLPAPTSAFLLPAGVAMRDALDRLLSSVDSNLPFALKWKVAACDPEEELVLAAGSTGQASVYRPIAARCQWRLGQASSLAMGGAAARGSTAGVVRATACSG